MSGIFKGESVKQFGHKIERLFLDTTTKYASTFESCKPNPQKGNNLLHNYFFLIFVNIYMGYCSKADPPTTSDSLPLTHAREKRLRSDKSTHH